MALLAVNFFSVKLNMNCALSIILPDRTREQGKRWPLLYLLHEEGGNHTAWQRNTRVERLANRWGMAMVLPSTLQGCYTDMANGYAFFSFLKDELPGIIARDYPSITADPQDTWVAGCGMGGFGALKWALHCPERFAAAGAFFAPVDIAKAFQRKIDAKEDVARLKNIWKSPQAIKGGPSDLEALAGKITQTPGLRFYLTCPQGCAAYAENQMLYHTLQSRCDVKMDAPAQGDAWDLAEQGLCDMHAWLCGQA